MQQRPKPKGWQLFALLPIMVGLLVLEAQAALSTEMHRIAQFLIVIAFLGAAWLWARVNEAATIAENASKIRLIEMLDPAEREETNNSYLEQIDWSKYGEVEPHTFDTTPVKGRYN